MRSQNILPVALIRTAPSDIRALLPLQLRKRRVILVDLFWTRDKDPRIALGHASLLATLRCTPALDVRSLTLAINEGWSIDDIAAQILRQAGNMPYIDVDVAIGAYIWNEAYLQILMPLLRGSGFRGRIILGGPQITNVGSGLEQLYPDADVFIRGQGEIPLREVVLSRHRTTVSGVHYAGEIDLCKQASAALDQLPSPWLDGLSLFKGQGFLRWETQRGCQFKCSFCQHRQPDARLKGVTFPTSRIMDEIDYICRMEAKEVAVLDPVFNSTDNPGQAIRVLNRFAENGFGGRLSLQCRAELIDDSFLDAAQALDVCLEFGLQTIHEGEYKAIDRPNNMKKVDEVLAKVRQRKIRHEVSLIFGLPEQTLASFVASVKWCIERKVPTIKAFPLLLLRGTKIELERNRWNLVVEDGDMPRVVESSTFCRHEWETMDAISQALHDTEKRHPSMRKLLKLARGSRPDISRWQPATAGGAV